MAARPTEDRRKAADIESPPRLIKVKAVGKKSMRSDGFLWLETRQVDEASELSVYVVENVRQGDPEQFSLKVFGGEALELALERAKEKRYYEVPIPVAAYDAATDGELRMRLS